MFNTKDSILQSAIVIFIVAAQCCVQGYPQESETNNRLIKEKHPGKYVPELHGGYLGRYIPDDSGKYKHIFVPYDGGYGDRGLQYEHDYKNYLPPQPMGFSLGPEDHVRFMIDFNYNDSGWRIIQFEWIRDGEEAHHINYVNENRLWDDGKPDDRDKNGVKSQENTPIVSDDDMTSSDSGVSANENANMSDGVGYLDDSKSEDVVNEPAVQMEEESIAGTYAPTEQVSSTNADEMHTDDITQSDVVVEPRNDNDGVNLLASDAYVNNANSYDPNPNNKNSPIPSDVKSAINLILEFIQTDILPSLT